MHINASTLVQSVLQIYSEFKAVHGNSLNTKCAEHI